MAILKHIASKNADYGETERYLIFQHDEYTQKPILDENGNMLLREEYYLDGMPVHALNGKELTQIRNEKIGFVFQNYHLIPAYTVLQNVIMPLLMRGIDHKPAEDMCMDTIRLLGLGERLHHKPNELSGGQKQRVAVARALITNPQLILADEPTGALDSKATDSILALFNQINEDGQTILMVTHSIKAASHAKRVLFIKDGEVFHQLYRGDMSTEELYAKISDTLTILTTGGERHE